MGSCLLYLLLLGPAIILAAPDANYQPSFPFRPKNVTGLGPLYRWVGSYYNATTQIELTSLIGSTVNQSVCPELRGKVLTHKFNSFLAITERGPYNAGHNPVNTLLTLWKPGVNFSDLPRPSTIWGLPALEWYLESAPWVIQMSKTTTVNDLGEKPPLSDIFNLTLAPSTRAPYTLTGEIIGSLTDFNAPPSAVSNFNLDLATCSSSPETDRFQAYLILIPSPEIHGWNWTYPDVSLQFDSQSANFSVDGYFAASRYLQPNILSVPVVHGKIKITFEGVIDPYHSDVLVNNSATPTWIRTVGFQNNSLNIDYSSASPGCPRPLNWSVAAIAILLLAAALCI